MTYFFILLAANMTSGMNSPHYVFQFLSKETMQSIFGDKASDELNRHVANPSDHKAYFSNYPTAIKEGVWKALPANWYNYERLIYVNDEEHFLYAVIPLNRETYLVNFKEQPITSPTHIHKFFIGKVKDLPLIEND